MAEVRVELNCGNCGNDYILEYDDEINEAYSEPTVCPFCEYPVDEIDDSDMYEDYDEFEGIKDFAEKD